MRDTHSICTAFSQLETTAGSFASCRSMGVSCDREGMDMVTCGRRRCVVFVLLLRVCDSSGMRPSIHHETEMEVTRYGFPCYPAERLVNFSLLYVCEEHLCFENQLFCASLRCRDGRRVVGLVSRVAQRTAAKTRAAICTRCLAAACVAASIYALTQSLRQ